MEPLAGTLEELYRLVALDIPTALHLGSLLAQTGIRRVEMDNLLAEMDNQLVGMDIRPAQMGTKVPETDRKEVEMGIQRAAMGTQQADQMG